MKPIICLPIAILIIATVWLEVIILSIPIIIVLIATGKDISGSLRWMLMWMVKPLQWCGFEIIQ